MTMDNELESKTLTTNYEEPYRPHLHFTPESQWMNDPNGMVYYEGEYHLFYQYHPDGKEWGPMHWGHAVSEDMLQWKHLPIALEPDDLGMIFSGSAVVDWHDSSGFFGGGHGLVAMYTSADGDFQQQSIAYSLDKGRSWIKYEGNPVIPNPVIKDFRDPKVLWHEPSKKWIMVLAAGQEVMFYTSSNLIEWTYASRFGEGTGAHGGVWECPDLFELQVRDTDETKWVLQVDIGEGAIAGGSGGQYFLGEFDGEQFVEDPSAEDVLWVDYGKDFYATQSFSDIPAQDGRRIWLAWMSNWQYANQVPTDPWRSAMSLPREVSLKRTVRGNVKLIQQPIREVNDLIMNTLMDETIKLNKESSVICKQPERPFIMNFKLKSEELKKVTFSLFHSLNDQKEALTIEVDRKEVSVNRKEMKHSQFHADFPAETIAPIESEREWVTLQLIVDRGSVEVFVNDGEQTMTNLVLPKQNQPFSIVGSSENNELEVECKGHILKSVWT
ncbi:levanase [Salipaludibacillus keqinensis]|uniref:Levanase n=1 Tax=Salipaludibacillus keqinensis TaxID=2045207 RepID=A0A323TEJ7_9BACI|nr:glycoside hydrolase family 32 protein [Salipaludibacillus keqinensis]PYZ93458.1 levanase [Salipaludibacillus keqinensis]